MKIVESLDGALQTVIKESDDVEEAQSALEASQAKDKAGNKKAAEREESNIVRQKEAIENAENRDGQLLQQKINSVQKAVERTEGDAEAAKEKADEAVKNIEEKQMEEQRKADDDKLAAEQKAAEDAQQQQKKEAADAKAKAEAAESSEQSVVESKKQKL